jgi:hypothetical protein
VGDDPFDEQGHQGVAHMGTPQPGQAGEFGEVVKLFGASSLGSDALTALVTAKCQTYKCPRE